MPLPLQVAFLRLYGTNTWPGWGWMQYPQGKEIPPDYRQVVNNPAALC